MKITKQARAALFVMLFAISILPGCGKNKNDGAPGIGIGVAPIAIPGQIAGNSTFVMTGLITSSFTGNMNGVLTSQGGSPVGQPYYRPNNGYDQFTLFLPATGQASTTATAVISLHPSTMAACGAGVYGSIGVAQVQITNETINPVSGFLSYSVRIYMTNGCSFVI